MPSDPPRLLLIDDDAGQLRPLRESLGNRLEGRATIEIWTPSKNEDPRVVINERLGQRPTLVVTDHDLTENGPAGLTGDFIVASCRALAIPVGDYSRKLSAELEEPDLFEFRFASEADEAANDIATLLLGFDDLAQLLDGRGMPDEATGWSSILAEALDHPNSAASFSLYAANTGASQQTVIQRLEAAYGAKRAQCLLATYVLGHLLWNGILKYPGPIVSDLALCSYLAIADSNAEPASKLFAKARYVGPFSSGRSFFWHEEVDDLLAEMSDEAKVESDLDEAQSRRAAVAGHLTPGQHKCNHCDGTRGGYRCPYTRRTTCELPQCSVPTTSWIPQGAYLSRVDKDYYDQWSPLLGL